MQGLTAIIAASYVEKDPLVEECIGKTIESLTIDRDDRLIISFSDTNVLLILADEASACCEHRYMSTDDDLALLKGHKLVDISLEDGPDLDLSEYGDCHEQKFLKIQTSEGNATVVTHNKHNGYYGGFDIVVSTEVK